MNGKIARTWRSLLLMVLVGLLGAGAGFAIGGIIGALTCDWNTKEAGCIEHSAYGAVIAASILIPLGVHLSSPRRGNIWLFSITLLTVAAIAGAGLSISIVGSGPQELSLIAIPVVQLTSSVAIRWMTPLIHWQQVAS